MINKSKITVRQTPVTRKFLMNLANRIYNSKNRTFLRLCNERLQNGPDPIDSKRTMHCGLGELYYAMTGVHPKVDNVIEDDIIELAVERSMLANQVNRVTQTAMTQIKHLDLPEALRDALLMTIKDVNNDLFEEERFRSILYEIPRENDDNSGDNNYLTATNIFRARSKRVAAKLREAAKLLPK